MRTVTVRDGRPAIDVKDRTGYAPSADMDEIGPTAAEAIYEGLQMTFWEFSAPELARGYGYGDVYQEGRSGGWLVVEGVPAFWEYDKADLSAAERELDELRARRLAPPRPSADFLPDAITDIGQEIAEAEEMVRMARAREKFRDLAHHVEIEIDYLRGQFLEHVHEEAERCRREPALAFDAACRDILTVES